MKKSISIIGAGNWGTTLAIMLASKGLSVELYSVFKEHNLQMKKSRTNALFLKGVRFPASLSINPSLSKTLQNQFIVIAIPVKFLRSVLKKIKNENLNLKHKVFISVSKGIEIASLKRVSQIIGEELKTPSVAVLSGPNIAREVLEKIPSASTLVCKNKRIAKELQKLFAGPSFRIYLNNDIIGVELGGALKNIIAISCGIADGLEFGTNTKAALVTRGLTEIVRLGKALGARPATFWGISGLGDLVTTCFSPSSRNRSVGEQIGRGKNIKEITKKMAMVAEGVETVKSAYLLSKKMHIDMPITKAVYSVLYKNKSPRQAVSELMVRPLKTERD